MYWTHPFQPELYKKHHDSQHPKQWERYQLLSYSEQVKQFIDQTQFRDTLDSHFRKQTSHLTFEITAPIVDIIIGEMFFHPNDHGSVSHTRALRLFISVKHESKYLVVVKNPLQFQLIVDYIGADLSFRQAQSVLQFTKQRTNLTELGSVNQEIVSNFARVVCAINLQALSSLLSDDQVWAFALANDASTHYGRSYFDNRIRFHRQGVLYNLHVIAIPMFDRHTARNIFNLISKFLDVLCSNWRVKLIIMGFDEANVMTRHVQDVVTQLEQKTDYKIYRTWCGLHQFDLVMHHGYEKLLNGQFLTITNAFIAHLRQQINLIIDMKATCSKLSNR